jgi:hypothetical protein
VAVEKLGHQEFTEIGSRQETLPTIFQVFWTFSTSQFSAFFRKTDFFISRKDYHHL